jgi:protein NrfD
MSLGAWGVLGFGGLAFLSFLGAVGRDERRHRFAFLRPPGIIGTIVSVLGGLAGFYLASYTGVLLAVTNRPIWSDTPLLGAVFVVSSASTSIALLLLLGSRRALLGRGLPALARFDRIVLVLELILIVALIVSLGSLAGVWLNAWGALLVLGVIGLGIILPLVVQLKSHTPAAARAAALLVLVGGLLLRVVIVLSSEAI